MIQLQTLAKNINEGLNEKLTGDLLSTPRGRYEFFVVADTADYKKADREGNTVTYYINGNLIVTSSNVESTQAGSLNATLGARLDLLVPVVDGIDEDGNKEIVATVRKILDEYFSTNGSGVMQGYYYGYQYNIAVSGARANFPMVGDGFIFSVDISYYFIENGVSSKSIELRINRYNVDYLTLGVSRSTTQESDTPSDTENGASKNVDLASVFAINITMPLLLVPYVDAFSKYLVGLREIGDPLDVILNIPTSEGTGTVSNSYRMTISEMKLNSEGALNASISVTLTEAME